MGQDGCRRAKQMLSEGVQQKCRVALPTHGHHLLPFCATSPYICVGISLDDHGQPIPWLLAQEARNFLAVSDLIAPWGKVEASKPELDRRRQVLDPKPYPFPCGFSADHCPSRRIVDKSITTPLVFIAMGHFLEVPLRGHGPSKFPSREFLYNEKVISPNPPAGVQQ